MKSLKFNLFLIIILIISVSGCFVNSQKVLKQNSNEKVNANTIVVVPVENKNVDAKAAQLFRSKLSEEIYFKGYSKISLEEIDQKLESLYVNLDKQTKSAINPKVLKDSLSADAGMYCILTEDNNSKIFYTTFKITASCDLRSAKTGDLIWNAKSEVIKRNFYFNFKGAKQKLRENFDVLIDEIVNDIIKTLPDGPNLRS
jgi:hypothetical protein